MVEVTQHGLSRLDSWTVHNFGKLCHWDLFSWMSRKRVTYFWGFTLYLQWEIGQKWYLVITFDWGVLGQRVWTWLFMKTPEIASVVNFSEQIRERIKLHILLFYSLITNSTYSFNCDYATAWKIEFLWQQLSGLQTISIFGNCIVLRVSCEFIT